MMKKRSFISFLLLFMISSAAYAQYDNVFNTFDPDTVEARRFDMGKMWTFENPPLDYFDQEYGFRPTEEWLEKVRKSALRFGGGCSASFISPNGLVMTNHHCVRGRLARLSNDERDLLFDGFAAGSLEEEIKMPGLVVDQLMVIEDITDKIDNAMAEGETEEQKINLRDEKVEELEAEFSSRYPDLVIRTVPLYNGGKYSLYGYKRYDDCRLVFVPDLRTAKLGGDYDNFTYPRYGLDCAFVRAYENGEPAKIDNYFKWNTKGPDDGDAVFVVGNPGSTDRLNTISQLVSGREHFMPIIIEIFEKLYKYYEKIVLDGNQTNFDLIATLYSYGNTWKAYLGRYEGVNDNYLLARKLDWEKKFKAAVKADPELNEKYGYLWSAIDEIADPVGKMQAEFFALRILSFYSSDYLKAADELVTLARQVMLPEEERKDLYKDDQLKTTIETMFPEEIDEDAALFKLRVQTEILLKKLGTDHPAVAALTGGAETVDEALEYMLANTLIKTPEKMMEMANEDPETILASKDPFISYVVAAEEYVEEKQPEYRSMAQKIAVYNKELGEALWQVYGDEIPPDATGTLRIADGFVKSYAYNGTVAPVKTTFYGALDHYFGYNGQFPFNLPDIWFDLPAEFDLSTPLDFISTNDIIGGNSGSPVINKDAEIVGLAFDGNIESLPGYFIYTTEANRTVSVHSAGMIEAIRDLYKNERLSEEILTGELTN